ncbi:MAG: hypothetical protein ACIAQ0_02820, partial [Phycisphaerales bacterium JB058]
MQKFFISHMGRYEGVVVPLSIISAFPGGTNGFIRALCAKDHEKRYGIDPRTPLFQRRWDRAKHLRPPHQRTADIMGPPFSTIGVVRDLKSSDFTHASIDQCTRRCLEYQLKFRHTEDERKLKKYAKLLEMPEIAPLAKPQYVVPPYFAFDRVGDAWFEICRRCIEASGGAVDGVPVWPILHPTDVAGFSDLGGIVQVLKTAGIDNVWLYPNDFR